MADVHDKCAALATEVTTLRQVLKKDMANPPSKSNAKPVSHPPKRTYARVAKTDSTSVPTTTKAQAPKAAGSQSIVGHNSSGKVIRVQGARRIWGTLKSSPSDAVLGTIYKLTEVKSNLQIKRKFKKQTGCKMLWWLVVRRRSSSNWILTGIK